MKRMSKKITEPVYWLVGVPHEGKEDTLDIYFVHKNPHVCH